MWNEAKPGATDLVGKGDDDIREMKTDVRVWTEKEHYPLGHATTPGQHLPGIIDTPELAPDAVTAEKIASGVDVSGKGFKAESAITAETATGLVSTLGLQDFQARVTDTPYTEVTNGFVFYDIHGSGSDEYGHLTITKPGFDTVTQNIRANELYDEVAMCVPIPKGWTWEISTWRSGTGYGLNKACSWCPLVLSII